MVGGKSTLVRPNIKYLLDCFRMWCLIESHEPVNAIVVFLERLSRWVADRPSIFENVPAAKSINMLPICENKSYCWLVIYIYIQDFMRNHPHLLVFIKSFTKNFMFLGLTSVEFSVTCRLCWVAQAALSCHMIQFILEAHPLHERKHFFMQMSSARL